VKTSYRSYEAFLRTASGLEKDALDLFRRLDGLTSSEILERESDLRHGAEIHALINAQAFDRDAEDLLSVYNRDIDAALEHAKEEE